MKKRHSLLISTAVLMAVLEGFSTRYPEVFSLTASGNSARSRYALQEPDWNSPRKINYSYLRLITQKRKNGGKVFPEGVVGEINGAAVELTGAVIPAEDVPRSGEMKRFWLVNPRVILAGCVYCNPPALSDMVFVVTSEGHRTLRVSPEELYSRIVTVTVKGRFFLGPERTRDGLEYLYRIEKN
jgi:hypothetical protein